MTYSSVLDGFEATGLYHQIPGILLGLMLLIHGGILLAIGLGIVREVRSSLCAWLGITAMVGAVLVRGMAPQTATVLLFGIGSLLGMLGPVLFIVASMRVYRLGA
ncbi:MAG: hypothetical protein CVT67_04620 [Actinobacteria bacterium HGW-Actinobacteria-7]|jgi:hypothetical protein|nr:MAG: hypothetical protein CVT67_04620 [Actinobacteria bacterium HGW-Actinobacteria-7]